MRQKCKTEFGYTIIETMIAISVFLVVMMTGMGSLVNANFMHQKSRDIRSIMDNLSFIMEDIGRNLRTGSKYHCFTSVDGDTIPATTSSVVSAPKSCGTGGWGIAFESTNGVASNHDDQWVYYIGTNGSDSKIRIYKSDAGPYAAASFIQLTPDEVDININASGFSILGAEATPTDKQQPFVTIRLVGTITYKNIATPFSLQTSISQRFIDI